MDVRTGLGPCNPGARTVRRGDSAVQRPGELQHDIGTVGPPMLEIGRENLLHLQLGHPYFDLDASMTESFYPGASDMGIGVEHPNDDTADLCGDQRVGAGRRPPRVGAGLEGHVHGRAEGPRPRGVERDDLGVRTSGRLGRSGMDASIFGHHHAADPGVGRAFRPRRPADLDRVAKMYEIALAGRALQAAGEVFRSSHRANIAPDGPLARSRYDLDVKGDGWR